MSEARLGLDSRAARRPRRSPARWLRDLSDAVKVRGAQARIDRTVLRARAGAEYATDLSSKTGSIQQSGLGRDIRTVMASIPRGED